MGLNAKKVQGPQNRVAQPPIEPDVYGARLVQVIDLGLQPQRPYKGQDKAPQQEIMFTYELVDQFMLDEEGNEVEDKPRWVSETLPFYGLGADKAKSTQRYNAFDPSGAFDGDFSKCIGVPVNVTIVNNVDGDKVYNNIGNVATMSVKRAAALPELKNPSKVFDLDAPDMETFKLLPQWIQDKLKANLNYKGSALEKALGGVKKEDKPEPKTKQPETTNTGDSQDEDQDRPY